jgi:hypothetical protein
VRIGMTQEWDNNMTLQQKQPYASNPSPYHAGIEATQDVMRWLWDQQFSTVADDAIS